MKTNLAVLMGLLMMGASAGALASASTPAGTLDMKAELSGGTCTLVNPDIVIDFPDVQVGTPAGTPISDKNYHFPIINCSTGSQSVAVTPTFTSDAGMSAAFGQISTTGTAKGIALNLRTAITDDWWASGTEKTFPVVNNSADVIVGVRNIVYSGFGELSAGNYNATVILNFAYQ
ncbi:TPA: fimbrial protein [Yersinia enterocolitica]